MTGKWHLGEWQIAHLPRARGFEHHYGFYGALIDSFTHTREGILDWHRNGKPVIEEGYSTFLLADEAAAADRAPRRQAPVLSLSAVQRRARPQPGARRVSQEVRAHAARAEPQRAQLECMDMAIGRVLEGHPGEGHRSQDAGDVPQRQRRPAAHHHQRTLSRLQVAVSRGRNPRAGRRALAGSDSQAGSKSDEMLHAVDLLPDLLRPGRARTRTRVCRSTAGTPGPRSPPARARRATRSSTRSRCIRRATGS